MTASGNTKNTPNSEPKPIPEHPSDYRLDQLYLGELQAEDDREVREHLAQCLHCKKRRKLRDGGLAAFPEVDPEALLRRVQLAAASKGQALARNRGQRRLSFWAFLAPPVLAAAALLLFVGLREDRSVDMDTGIRTKGGLALRVFRQDMPVAKELLSGQDLAKGDTIGFVVHLPTELSAKGDLQAILLSVEEQGGKRSTYFPSGGHSSVNLILDSEGALPVATKLDSYLGMETLLLVVCPQPFVLETLMISPDSHGVSQVMNLAEGCHQSRFRMHKLD